MTVEELNSVDFVGVGEDQVILLISDHLSWDKDIEDHLYLLQEKINSYLRFYESGELLANFANAEGKNVIIEVHTKYKPSKKAKEFFSAVKSVLHEADVGLFVNVVN